MDVPAVMIVAREATVAPSLPTRHLTRPRDVSVTIGLHNPGHSGMGG
jgi:hypothetical protein